MLDDPARNAEPHGTELEPKAAPSASGASETAEPPFGSLAEDVSALYEDGRTYVEAELAFQKSRAAYAGENTKQGIIFGLAAFAFLHLALIGLVVGLIFALAPIIGGFIATAVVVGTLLAGVGLFGWLAAKRFRNVSASFKNASDEQA